ncbi:phage repressor protein CI [Vibrio sp. 10N.222.54.F12]|uniref:phage repressor protein CI n=1 Tax=Vibrio TaxID=662 RepID=UPI000C825270|nr:phage repressor protein CI [Vibrio tasmaniensis]PML19370.1 chromosome partitioning protein ParA [Vibrio tasmaniensis]PML46683.1 chromosome partitioning protein ParA [Vibrio tasmaniensis]
MKIKKIPPFDYLKGSEFTENLKHLTGCKNFVEMASVYGVPKTTFSTWNTHDRTSHELIVRAHLALGIPVEELALPDSELSKVAHGTTNIAKPQNALSARATRERNKQTDSVILPSVCLSDGKLINTGEIPYALRRINKYDLADSDVIEVETNDGIYLVNQDIVDAVSGKYLIDIDGHLSINQIQRLPGKKLAVAFGDSTMEVSEEDIKVVGRVAVVLEKV